MTTLCLTATALPASPKIPHIPGPPAVPDIPDSPHIPHSHDPPADPESQGIVINLVRTAQFSFDFKVACQ